MYNKKEIVEKLSTPLVMKSKTISHIILEGTDGVGKTTMLMNLLKLYNYQYIVYDRGEISNFFYAKKYNRPFVSLQRNLPFLHVVLTCKKDEIKKRIIARQKVIGQNNLEVIEELKKVDDQDKFIQYANDMKNDFHIIIVDITGLNEIDATLYVASKIDEYVNSLETDKEETLWNDAYRKACKKLHYKFDVRNNQPYINDEMFMSESTWQNGVYETFTDHETMPDNLIFSLSYSKDCYKLDTSDKTIDFAYVINSKINRRPEVIDYYLKMLEANKTCLVSEKVANAFDKDNRMIEMPRVFGDEFIKHLSKANATIYCARDLEYLKLQTCRLYEGIIANQIVFVDKESDKDCDMLRQIHFDENIVDLLYVTPDTFIKNYDEIMSNHNLREKILNNQKTWYKQLKMKVFHDSEL